MRKVILGLVVVAICMFAIGASTVGTNSKFEDVLAQVSLRETGLSGLAQGATLEEQMLLEAYGVEALIAERRFPGRAVVLFEHFGDTPEFQEILYKYGYHQVVPVVWRFWDAPSIAFTAKRGAAIALKQGLDSAKSAWATLSGGEAPAVSEPTPSIDLTPLERAWEAINRIRESGNNMLGRYEIDEQGFAQTQRIRTGVAIAEEFLIGGIETIERKYSLSQEITASEAALAAIETVALTAATFGVLRNLTKARFGEKLAARSALAKSGKSGLMARTALAIPKGLVMKAAKYTLVGAGIWLVVRHPGVIHSFFAAVAEAIGVPVVLGQLLGWIGIFLVPVFICWPLIILLASFWRLFSRLWKPAPLMK